MMENVVVVDDVSSLQCQSILIECGWKKNQTQINEIITLLLLLKPHSPTVINDVEKCVSFRMKGKAKVKTTTTTAQQCDAMRSSIAIIITLAWRLDVSHRVCMDDPFSYLLHHIVS